MKYRAGDRVKIVSESTMEMDSQARMDVWLGKVMTIKAILADHRYLMKEGDSEFCWDDNMIAGLEAPGIIPPLCRMISIDDAIDLIKNRLIDIENILIVDTVDDEIYKPGEVVNMTFRGMLEWITRDSAIVLVKG